MAPATALVVSAERHEWSERAAVATIDGAMARQRPICVACEGALRTRCTKNTQEVGEVPLAQSTQFVSLCLSRSDFFVQCLVSFVVESSCRQCLANRSLPVSSLSGRNCTRCRVVQLHWTLHLALLRDFSSAPPSPTHVDVSHHASDLNETLRRKSNRPRRTRCACGRPRRCPPPAQVRTVTRFTTDSSRHCHVRPLVTRGAPSFIPVYSTETSLLHAQRHVWLQIHDGATTASTYLLSTMMLYGP